MIHYLYPIIGDNVYVVIHWLNAVLHLWCWLVDIYNLTINFPVQPNEDEFFLKWDPEIKVLLSQFDITGKIHLVIRDLFINIAQLWMIENTKTALAIVKKINK